jgi:hypothetical protein
MDQGICVAGEGNVGDGAAGFAREKEEIARADPLGRDAGSVEDLLRRVPGESHPTRCERGLHQSGAVDTPRGDSTPLIRASLKMLQGPALGRFGSCGSRDRAELPDIPGTYAPAAAIRQGNRLAVENNSRTQRQWLMRATHTKHGTLNAPARKRHSPAAVSSTTRR